MSTCLVWCLGDVAGELLLLSRCFLSHKLILLLSSANITFISSIVWKRQAGARFVKQRILFRRKANPIILTTSMEQQSRKQSPIRGLGPPVRFLQAFVELPAMRGLAPGTDPQPQFYQPEQWPTSIQGLVLMIHFATNK